jgi:hypothetical protein
LITFCRNTEPPVYIRIAEALERIKDPDPGADTGCPTTDGVNVVYERMAGMREPLFEEESKTATELVRGGRSVQVPDTYDSEKPDSVPEPITLPEPRLLSDYTTAPYKHECGIIKQIRHAKQAHQRISTLKPIKQTLLRATAWQFGLNTAHCHSSTIKDVVKLDRLEGMGGGSRDGGSREAAQLCAATLHRYGLPMDYARMKTETLPETCACCNAPL